MNVVGLFAFDENPAACILVDGKLGAFVEEERLSRVKGSPGAFPKRALRYSWTPRTSTSETSTRLPSGGTAGSTRGRWAGTSHAATCEAGGATRRSREGAATCRRCSPQPRFSCNTTPR